MNVPIGETLAGPAVAAPPAPTPSPSIAILTIKTQTAPVHLPVIDSSSSDESVPTQNSSSNENLADLNLLAAETARIPVDPLIAVEIRQQRPEVRVPLVSSSPSADNFFPPLQQ